MLFGSVAAGTAGSQLDSHMGFGNWAAQAAFVGRSDAEVEASHCCLTEAAVCQRQSFAHVVHYREVGNAFFVTEFDQDKDHEGDAGSTECIGAVAGCALDSEDRREDHPHMVLFSHTQSSDSVHACSRLENS